MSETTTPLLSVDAVRLRYGGVEALTDTSLEARSSEVIGLVGANGAGKSSLLDVVAGVRRPTGGTVRLCGSRVDGLPAHRVARRGVGYAREQRNPFGSLTVEENLRVGGHGLERHELEQRLRTAYEAFPVLAERRRQLAETLSGGEQRMLTIARASVRGRRLLLLDEPSRGLAPEAVDRMWRLVGVIGAEGGAVLVAEQDPHRVPGAHRSVVLEHGRIVA